MFIYDDHPLRTTRPFRVEEFDATHQYVTHFSNSLLLKFYHTHPSSTPLERIQASKELTITERKMAFWQKQQNYDDRAALEAVVKLKTQWSK